MRLASFVLGGLAGAVVAALLAPRRGVETRRALGHRLGRLPDEEHERSPTAVAAEMLAAGVVGVGFEEPRIPHDDRDEVAGGDMPSSDHGEVDEIGRAYGVTNIDDGALRASAELLKKRDRRPRRR